MTALSSLLKDFDAIKAAVKRYGEIGWKEDGEKLIRSNAGFFMEIIEALRKPAVDIPSDRGILMTNTKQAYDMLNKPRIDVVYELAKGLQQPYCDESGEPVGTVQVTVQPEEKCDCAAEHSDECGRIDRCHCKCHKPDAAKPCHVLSTKTQQCVNCDAPFEEFGRRQCIENSEQFCACGKPNDPEFIHHAFGCIVRERDYYTRAEIDEKFRQIATESTKKPKVARRKEERVQ